MIAREARACLEVAGLALHAADRGDAGGERQIEHAIDLGLGVRQVNVHVGEAGDEVATGRGHDAGAGGRADLARGADPYDPLPVDQDVRSRCPRAARRP